MRLRELRELRGLGGLKGIPAKQNFGLREAKSLSLSFAQEKSPGSSHPKEKPAQALQLRVLVLGFVVMGRSLEI